MPKNLFLSGINRHTKKAEKRFGFSACHQLTRALTVTLHNDRFCQFSVHSGVKCWVWLKPGNLQNSELLPSQYLTKFLKKKCPDQILAGKKGMVCFKKVLFYQIKVNEILDKNRPELEWTQRSIVTLSYVRWLIERRRVLS